ncbi:MAG: hypothetical protein ACRENE_33350 [Polyangiaceae bacterium]
MQLPSIALDIATGAFVLTILWRVRPAFGPVRRSGRLALREARARIEQATDEPSRARALCDAADIVVGDAPLAGSARAQGLYLRALRADPGSAEVVARAVVGLARRPRTLEALLWRHLGSADWRGPCKPAMAAALDALRGLYEGPLRNAVRARAIGNAREALGGTREP